MKNTFTKIVRLCASMLLAGALSITVNAQDHPDLSGLWFPSFQPNSGQFPRETPFNDFAQQIYDDYVVEFDVSDDPGGYCIKPGLPRSIWGAPFPVEIVQTDEFINMFWEGYFQYRKIYMEGYDRPEPILPTRMGYSVGRWEGDTLVIETSYLREYPYMRRLPNTEEATVVERITVETRIDDNGEENKYLTNELVLTDNNLYTEPVMVRGILRYSPDTPIMEYSCSEEIYENYLQEKGLTPPDLYQ